MAMRAAFLALLLLLASCAENADVSISLGGDGRVTVRAPRDSPIFDNVYGRSAEQALDYASGAEPVVLEGAHGDRTRIRLETPVF